MGIFLDNHCWNENWAGWSSSFWPYSHPWSLLELLHRSYFLSCTPTLSLRGPSQNYSGSESVNWLLVRFLWKCNYTSYIYRVFAMYFEVQKLRNSTYMSQFSYHKGFSKTSPRLEKKNVFVQIGKARSFFFWGSEDTPHFAALHPKRLIVDFHWTFGMAPYPGSDLRQGPVVHTITMSIVVQSAHAAVTGF